MRLFLGINFKIIYYFILNEKKWGWGLGIGDWGLGIRDLDQFTIDNIQFQILNSQ